MYAPLLHRRGGACHPPCSSRPSGPAALWTLRRHTASLHSLQAHSAPRADVEAALAKMEAVAAEAGDEHEVELALTRMIETVSIEHARRAVG